MKKIFIAEKSNSQFEKIQDMEMKKKKLEDILNNLQKIEEELRQVKKSN
ncbi:hypothetical protein [Aquimarina sp. MMG016]|nr:hypothetical protein [Aquimarina sp. MMG016]MBQ4820914.1 hypothetical protein [Aquimarina sp. MMG016]